MFGFPAIPQWLYYDRLSRDPATKRVKDKYKLCARTLIDLDLGIFYVSTSQESAYDPAYTVMVSRFDWLDTTKEMYWTSHLSPENLEILTSVEVEAKQKDRQNGFQMVARIPPFKYALLLECTRRWKIEKEAEGIGLGDAVQSIADWDPSEWLRSVGLA